MPFVFVRSNRAKALISETKERVKRAVSGMSDSAIKEHLDGIRSQYEDAKIYGADDSKILYHELEVVKAEFNKRRNSRNAKLARHLEKLQKTGKLKCPHCGKRFEVDH